MASFPFTLDQTDPYGTDLAFDDTGDLVVWANGALGTISDADNCVQALKLWTRTDEGELPLAPSFGSAFPRMVGMKGDFDVALARAQGELQRIMGGDHRFLAVADVDVTETPGDKMLLRAVLQLVAGEQLQISGEVDDPTAFDIISVDDVDATDLDTLAELAQLDFFDDPIEQDAISSVQDQLDQLGLSDLADQLDQDSSAQIQELAEDLDPSTTETDAE